MNSNKRRSFYIVLLPIALIASFWVGLVLADHVVFSGMHPEGQKGVSASDGKYRNYIVLKWAVEGRDIRWRATSRLRNDVRTVIGKFETGNLADLRWTYTEGQDWDIDFHEGTCDGLDARALFTQWEPDRDRNARYIEKVRVCVNRSVNWATDARQGTIAHEIGHFYGLDEQYIDRDTDGDGQPEHTCNPSKTKTIMDGNKEIRTSTTTPGTTFHCDNLLGPESIDLARITKLYNRGQLADFDESSNGSSLEFTWKDEAWGESLHDMSVWVWNNSTSSPRWKWLDDEQVTENTGLHKAMPSPVKPLEVSMEYRPSQRGWYMACGYPYFRPFGNHGTWKCSDKVWSSGPSTSGSPAGTPRPSATMTPTPLPVLTPPIITSARLSGRDLTVYYRKPLKTSRYVFSLHESTTGKVFSERDTERSTRPPVKFRNLPRGKYYKVNGKTCADDDNGGYDNCGIAGNDSRIIDLTGRSNPTPTPTYTPTPTKTPTPTATPTPTPTYTPTPTNTPRPTPTPFPDCPSLAPGSDQRCQNSPGGPPPEPPPRNPEYD